MPEKSRRHPSALYVLCLVEGCERFAASALLSLFALYLTQHRRFADSEAILIVGGLLAGSYLASWPAGWLADRWLGVRRTAQLGALLLGLGYAALWVDSAALFWGALSLLIVGQGLFRAGIATLVGQLCDADPARREAGFSLFYLSVNLGYLAGPFSAEWSRARWDWPAVFVLASTAVLISLLLLSAVRSSERGPSDAKRRVGAAIPRSVERARIRALWLFSGLAVVFWIALQQTGTALPLFAEHNTERHWALRSLTGELAPGHFASLHGALALAFSPALPRALAWLRARQLAHSTPTLLVWGLIATAAAFALMSAASLSGGDQGRVHLLWLVLCYVLISGAEVLWGSIGLALVSELAPPRLASRMAGLWYASIALGYLLAGGLGQLWQRWSHHRYFVLVAALCLAAAALLFIVFQRVQLSQTAQSKDWP